MIKKWIIGQPDKTAADALVSGGLSRFNAEVLVSAGIKTIEEAEEFFGGSDLGDPFLIKDMDKAVEIINESAFEKNEKILIYGDYDCDGVCATAILASFLEMNGADVYCHINTREEGFGLNETVIKNFAGEGYGLIITVDNGTSALKEAKLIKDSGIKLVITDHHEPGETLPVCDALVNPHRADDESEFKDLCGCGVVLKLIAALDGGDPTFALEQFSDIACIATIGDVVKLRGENRVIVEHGLHYLENTENIGLISLIKAAGMARPFTSTSVAFGLCPRINAAGRLDTALTALDLLMCDNAAEAQAAAETVNRMNIERKELENRIIRDIFDNLKENSNSLSQRVLSFYGSYHHGVIGIVASRLVERFGKPIFIMSDDAEGYVKGSARGIAGFSIFSALSYCADLLTKFGGHEGAGGFSLKKSNLDAFNKRLNEYAAGLEHMPVYFIEAAKQLLPEDLTIENAEGLKRLAPFGEGNPEPLFFVGGALITKVLPLKDGKFTKLLLNYGGTAVEAITFGCKYADFPLKPDNKIDLITYLEVNEYLNSKNIQLKIKDFRPHGINQQKLLNANAEYEKFKRGEAIDPRLKEKITPVRDDFAQVYKLIKPQFMTVDYIFNKTQGIGDINYFKFRIILDTFREAGFIDCNLLTDSIKLSGNKPAEKVDLFQMPTMVKL
ncbi:MAG: single-stranded-DNA-specific exonuclease RecJ [Ruminococcus sp.]|jgi:single-stranded-DNA-specific exonuclease|nr:single-stranded-DNA-specific exonuclease RecJ [Ruminococcus sp.]